MPPLPAAAAKMGGVKEERASACHALIENTRWPSRSDAVTALGVWAANNGKRSSKSRTSPERSASSWRATRRWSRAAVTSATRSAPNGTGRPYTATITEVHPNNAIDVMFDDDCKIKSGLARGEYKLKHSREVHDKSAPCKMYVVFTCNNSKGSASPWLAHLYEEQ